MIPRVIPAQLSFLAIYNPSLGSSDETLHDQIVFYYSKAARPGARNRGDRIQPSPDLREQQNEQLRQVGLAQGMVGFARGFSNGEAVESIETEKSRIVLHELEPGWWIVAVSASHHGTLSALLLTSLESIDLTQLPADTENTSAGNQGSPQPAEPATEYSSREVSPPALLVQQLVRANSVFLLHHGTNLQGLFDKLGREKFCNILDKYWANFAAHWDVLLHGSPTVEIFGGMKLAAGGELGMGVGEEEWGSGEREVLEDLARRTEGLVDFMVSRFGEPSPLQTQSPKAADNTKGAGPPKLEPWIGRCKDISTGDGVVFSGVGSLSRRSLRDISRWVEDIYTFGEYAYGVRESPNTNRRRRRKKQPAPSETSRSEIGAQKGQEVKPPAAHSGQRPGIPPPIVKAAESSLDKASNAVGASENTQSNSSESNKAPSGDTESWMKYLTLGYGTAWGGQRSQSGERNASPHTESQGEPIADAPMRYIEPEPDVDQIEEKIKRQVDLENSGYFLIGLKGMMEEGVQADAQSDVDWNNRILIRTVHAEVLDDAPQPSHTEEEKAAYEKELVSMPRRAKRRLRAVVYVHRPFIYTFVFHQRTESLSLSTFYRNLHTYLSPLHRPLSSSTSPDRVEARVSAASRPYTTTSSSAKSTPNMQRIYDLIYDPRTLTVHTTVPNIPEPGTLIGEGLSSTDKLPDWSRAEALNVHSQMLATVANTRHTGPDIERTCKTSRGWWVVWLRLPPSSADVAADAEVVSQTDTGFKIDELREAFLVRRAHDAAALSKGSSGSGLGSGLWNLGRPSTSAKMGGTAAGWGPRGLAEGIGIDARRYAESLLSLSR